MPHDKVTSPTATMNGGALLEECESTVQAIRCTHQKHRVFNIPPHTLKNDRYEDSTTCWRIASVRDLSYPFAKPGIVAQKYINPAKIIMRNRYAKGFVVKFTECPQFPIQ
jgi:hypothetical protein